MKVTVVTSDPSIAGLICHEARGLGCEPLCVDSLESAVAGGDLVFFEWPIHDLNAIEIITTLRKAGTRRPPVFVVLLVPGHSIAILDRAQQFGASDALFSPPDSVEIRAEILEARLGCSPIGEHLRKLRETDLIGQSDVFQKAVAEIPIAASSDVNVLLLGETGTGKEIFAKAIHSLSARSSAAYMAVNCASLAPGLMESELFGHVKGSFTGADRDHKGRFEAVGGGTLLLDEIGDIPLHLQTKLLRAIAEKRFERVGENPSQVFHGRILAATSMDLEHAIRENAFRPDLLGRLNQIQIRLPALRERPSDIPLLASYFLRKHANGRNVYLSPTALEILQSFDFPRNVRQMENALIGALARCRDGDVVLPRHLPDEILRRSPQRAVTGARNLSYAEAREAAVRSIDREYLTAVLKRHGGNQSAVAEELGIDRKTLAARWKAVQEGAGG